MRALVWLALAPAGLAVSIADHSHANPRPPTAAVGWVKYTDPLEQAFTIDVPQGWTVKGGMFRLGYSDHRLMVDLTSPDGRVNVRLGDVAIPTYFLPTPYHREGDVADLGAQAQGRFANYRPGSEFATRYATVRFKSLCDNLAPRPDAGPMPAPPADDPAQQVQRSSQGQATYTCTSSKGDRVAYVYARTAEYPSLWQAADLASFLAPADEVPLARSVIERAAASFHLVPAWIAKQNELDRQGLVYQRQRQQERRRVIDQQVAQFEMKMQAMQNQVGAFEARQAQQAHQVENWGNILTGITPTVDPYGNEHEVWTGTKSRYWINGQGQSVNANESPGPGYQEQTIRP